MKIDAGGKLKTRKPTREPARHRSTTATDVWPVWIATTKKMADMTKATPAESPSMLSNRLKALVIPTIHSTLSPAASRGLGRKSVNV